MSNQQGLYELGSTGERFKESLKEIYGNDEFSTVICGHSVERLAGLRSFPSPLAVAVAYLDGERRQRVRPQFGVRAVQSLAPEVFCEEYLDATSHISGSAEGVEVALNLLKAVNMKEMQKKAMDSVFTSGGRTLVALRVSLNSKNETISALAFSAKVAAVVGLELRQALLSEGNRAFSSMQEAEEYSADTMLRSIITMEPSAVHKIGAAVMGSFLPTPHELIDILSDSLQ